MPLAPGVHQNVPFDIYLADPAVSRSDLKHMLECPAKARYEKDHPDPHTQATAIGEHVHAALLSPEVFGRRFVLPPDVGRRNNADKKVWADWKAANPEAVEIKRSDWELAVALAKAARSHRIARALLDGPGKNELTIVWDDPATGVRCKARLDRITTYEGWPTIVDLKNVRSVSDHAFSRAMHEYGWYRQSAWYLRAARAIRAIDRRFLFLAIEKEPPYPVRVFTPGDGALAQGDDENRRALHRWKECLETGIWPGHAEVIEPIDLPRYAQKDTVEPLDGEENAA